MKTIPTLIQSDFYKQGHYGMYPENTEMVYSNLTPRKSRIPEIQKVVHFGTQYFIKEYLIRQWNENFFGRNWNYVEREYTRMINATMGPGLITTDHIKELHNLGYLPLHIKAIPEGRSVPVRVPMMTIRSTVDHAYWLTNFLETIYSTTIWQPCTSATLAKAFRQILMEYAEKTGDVEKVKWQGHDFSMRGMSSLETACLSGAGHLLSFTGTDTIPAISFLEHYYGADVEKELVGASVPATEHSIMCMGQKEGEIDTLIYLLDKYPRGILSIVSDTWSLPKVITEYLPLPQIRDRIMAREGKTVIRPDSFWTDPVDCICGYEGWHPQMAKLNSAERKMIKKGVTESLYDIFGGTINSKGYKELNSHIGSIYGDSISLERAKAICERLMKKGIATTENVLGIGSYTYQYNTRDTFGFAIKATYGIVNGEPREIYKDPITDDGMKKSAKGLLKVTLEDGEYVLHDQITPEEEREGELKTVFLNGTLVKDFTLAEIRKNMLM